MSPFGSRSNSIDSDSSIRRNSYDNIVVYDTSQNNSRIFKKNFAPIKRRKREQIIDTPIINDPSPAPESFLLKMPESFLLKIQK